MRLTWRSLQKASLALLDKRSLHNVCVWEVWLHNEQDSQALLCPPSLQRPAARAPCSLQSGVQFLPSAPASPTHQPRSPRGRLARPAPAAETEGTPGDPWTGRGLSAGDPALRAMPPGWSRARLRKPQAGRRAGAPEAGFIPAPAALWGRLGGGQGTGKNWRRRSLGAGGAAQVGAEASGTSLRLVSVSLQLLGGEEWPGRRAPPAVKQQTPS